MVSKKTTIINQHSPKAWIEISNALLTPVVAVFGAEDVAGAIDKLKA